MDLHDGVCVVNEKHHRKPGTVINTVQALGLSLQQASANFKDLVVEFQELKIESERYKSQLVTERKQYENKTCNKCIDLQNIIASKEDIIQLTASALTKLNDTKNFSIISEMFKIIFGDTTTLTPPKDTESSRPQDIITKLTESKLTCSTPNLVDKSTSNVKEESFSEIESTPTGRTSPIIQSKKSKSVKGEPTEAAVKKKCSNSWPEPDTKVIRLSYPSASLLKTPKANGQKGKLRQARLALVKQKSAQYVDLTSSPELRGSPGKRLNDAEETKLELSCIKKEPTDYDDTILPSPTSGPMRSIFKTASIKGSPKKFIKPSVFKTEPVDMDLTRLTDGPGPGLVPVPVDGTRLVDGAKPADVDADETRLDSPVSLKYFKMPISPKKPIPPPPTYDENCSQFETNVSLSLLQHVALIEKDALNDGLSKSPPKRPLAENKNVTNLPAQSDSEVSISVLQCGQRTHRQPSARTDVAGHKRKTPEKPEDIYKEPTARTKAEKRALPGWSCDECKNFYGELYRDNPEMLLVKMQECSRHRGRRDPARPATPPNFWNPRWDVPDDTEAFNRRNNAA